MNLNNLAEVPKKYEEKFINIMTSLGKMSTDNLEELNLAENKLQQDVLEMEKMIEEENINRINANYKVILGHVNKLKELGYDFPSTRAQPYEKLIHNLSDSLKNL